MYVDARTYMIDDVLTKVDRMSMAVSLEAREPLLDHKLLEFAARVPVVAEAEGRPEQVPAAPSAREARAARDHRAQEERLRRADRRVAARAARADGRASCCSTAACATAASSTTAKSPGSGTSIAAGRADHRHRLWQLIMLELWFREFIEEPADPAADGLAGRAALAGSGRR